MEAAPKTRPEGQDAYDARIQNAAGSGQLAVIEEAEEFDLLALIDEQLDAHESADPHVVAAAVLEAIPADQYRSVLAKYLHRQVARRIHLLRSQDRHPTLGAVNDRWEAVRDGKNAGALRILRWRISVGEKDWKFFEDCTRTDVEQIVADYTRRAVENADQAQRFKAVLSAMEESKVERVGDVELDQLVTIFHA